MEPRLKSVRAVLVVCVAVLAWSCASSGPTGDVDKIAIEISQFDVTITNTAGFALVEVYADIIPVGHRAPYSLYVGRLENGEKRSFGFNRFTDRDAVPFSPRTARAVAAAVRAKDLNNADLRVQVPWK